MIVADPAVRKWLLKVPGNVLVLEAPVNRSEYSRNPEYPYRKHPQFQIKVIPSLFEIDKVMHTLLKQKNAKVLKSLIDEDCSNDALLEAFIQ